MASGPDIVGIGDAHVARFYEHERALVPAAGRPARRPVVREAVVVFSTPEDELVLAGANLVGLARQPGG